MKFTVPFITEITELYEVDARSGNEATMVATERRLRGDDPTHKHVTKFRLGVVRTTIEEPEAESAADEG